MLPLVQRKNLARLVLLRAPQVKQWQLRMFPSTPTAALIMLLKPSPQPIPLMPKLKSPKNAIGNHGVSPKI